MTVKTVLKTNGNNSKWGKKDIIFAVIIILIIVFFASGGFSRWANIFEGEEEHVTTSADVQLYRFSDLIDNDSINVEIVLINIGEETANEIWVFVRVRNQNGTTVFLDELTLTSELLRENETNSAEYSIARGNNTEFYHTLEISWNGGRNSYYKTTKI